MRGINRIALPTSRGRGAAPCRWIIGNLESPVLGPLFPRIEMPVPGREEAGGTVRVQV